MSNMYDRFLTDGDKTVWIAQAIGLVGMALPIVCLILGAYIWIGHGRLF